MVAISFFVPALDGNAIGAINKCLRGYTQLGVYTFVERAKYMQACGFEKAYIGSINNDFKKKFISSGGIQKNFAREIIRKPGFMTSPKYLQKFF